MNTTPGKTDNDPALALGFDLPVGRLYRKPETELPENISNNMVRDLVREGTLVPSTTNVISVKASPHLIPWATRKSAESVINMVKHNANNFVKRVKENPFGAISYISTASDRERDFWGNQGSTIHLGCELLAKEESLSHLTFTPYENQSLDQFKKWLDIFQPNFKFLEVTGFGKTSSGKGYGFTTDFVAEIEGDLYAGDYKCVTDDTPILFPDGSTKPAIDIVEGDEIVAWDKTSGLHTAKVLYAGDNGNHKTVTVTTISGHKLTTTLNHPYWASRKSQKLSWVQAEDLKVGDEVYIAMGWNYSQYRQPINWPFNKYLSPYTFGVLWALRNFNNTDWAEKTPMALPPISGEGLKQELQEMSFKFNREGNVIPTRGLTKIAKKNDMTLDELLELLNTPELPAFVYAGNQNSYGGFLTGIMEVFANRSISHEELIVVMNQEALVNLQAVYTNYGQQTQLINDNRSSHSYLKAPFETKDTIFTHGISATKIVDLEYSDDVEHTVAIEVEGSHTHVTAGIVTHNTNRRGLHPEIGLQLSANARGTELTTDNKTLIPAPSVVGGLGVHISPEGVTTRLVNIDDSVYEIFEALREAWDFYAFEGTLYEPIFLKLIQSPKDL